MKGIATGCLITLWVLAGVVLCPLAGCNDKKFVTKTIPVRPGLSLIWYHYSLITSNGPDYVEFSDSTTGSEEVIFEAQEICQIQVESDSVNILMQGNSIIAQARHNSYGYKIVVDTSCRGVDLYK